MCAVSEFVMLLLLIAITFQKLAGKRRRKWRERFSDPVLAYLSCHQSARTDPVTVMYIDTNLVRLPL